MNGSTISGVISYAVCLVGGDLGFALFVATSLWGRVWCGYVCPQTVFMEGLIRKIERFIEGPHYARIKRNQGSLSLDKLWRKALKHAVFIGVALGLLAIAGNTSAEAGTLTGAVVSLTPFIDVTAEGMFGQAATEDLETLFQLIHLTMTEPRADDAAVIPPGVSGFTIGHTDLRRIFQEVLALADAVDDPNPSVRDAALASLERIKEVEEQKKYWKTFADELGNRPSQADARLILGKIHLERMELEAARRELRAALDLGAAEPAIPTDELVDARYKRLMSYGQFTDS